MKRSLSVRVQSAFVAVGLVSASVAACLPALAGDQPLPVLRGEPSATLRPKVAAPRMDIEDAGAASRIELPFQAIAIAAEADKQALEGRTRIGVSRDVASGLSQVSGESLHWRASGSGLAARLEVRSPGAAALRVAVVPLSVAGLEVRVAGADRLVAGPVRAAQLEAAARAQGAWWSPVTSGDVQVLEFSVPDAAAASALRLRIDSVSHLVADPAKSAAKSSAASGSCNQDVACVPGSSLGIDDVSRSVAKIVYTSRGATYACSATLVNDLDGTTQIPYLLTAAHCVGSAEVAATVTSYWFYEKRSCNGDSPDPVKLSGGATLLFANGSTDVALLRLNEPAPAGAYFAGIDPNPLATGDFVVALHHPRGDPMKVSSGLRMSDVVDSVGRSFAIAWMVGTTEPGSSGAGAFSRAGGSYYLRGTLNGGAASCSSSGNLADESNRDYFARLDGDFPSLGAYLLAGASPQYDYAGLWSDPKDPGWGLSIVRQGGDALAAVWFTHDSSGESVWTWIADGTWKSATRLEAALYFTEAASSASPDAARVKSTRAGDVAIEFADRDHLSFTVRMDGTVRTYALERQPG